MYKKVCFPSLPNRTLLTKKLYGDLLSCSTLNNQQTRRPNSTVSRFAAKRTSAFRRCHEHGKRTGSPARLGLVISERAPI